MLVQGFIDLVGHCLCGASDDKLTILGGGTPPAGNIEVGSPEYTWGDIEASSVTSQIVVQAYRKTILLGTSDTLVKSTDCTITQRQDAKLGTVSVSRNKVVVTGTYTNSTSETKTFKEIGLSMEGRAGNKYYSILLSRSVFPEPVVIPAGESKSFTITIDFNKFADTVVTA